MEEFNSALMTGTILKKSLNSNDESTRVIRGYCSVPIVDIENEIISPTAYDSAIQVVKDRVNKGRPIPIFIEHRRKELSLPVGSVMKAGKDEKGLWFEGKIANGNIGDSVWDLIRQNMLYSVSMGGDATKKSRRYDKSVGKDVTVIDDLVWRELSLTGLPVNEEAVFSIAKSLDTGKKDKKKVANEISKSMKKLDTAIDFEKSLHDIKETNDALKKAINGDQSALSPDQINKIAESMKTLARLLGIQSSFETGGQPQENGMQQQDQQNDEQQDMTDQATENLNDNVDENQQNTDQAAEELNGNEEVGMQDKKQMPPKMANEQNQQQENTDEQTIDDTNGQAEQTEERPEEQAGKQKPVKGKKVNPFMKKKKKGQEDINAEEDGEDGKAIGEETMDIQKDENLDAEQKLDKIIKLLETRKGGDKSMDEEIIKCAGCDSTFEKSEYDVNFCPKCGEDLLKSEECDEDEKEEKEEGEEEDEDLEKSEMDGDSVVCEGCDSFFAKSDEYDMSYCPKCGKSVIAVAESPKGTDTKYDNKTGDKDGGTEGSVAVSESPKGTSTKWKKSQQKLKVEKNLTVDHPEKGSAASVEAFDGENYIDSTAAKTENDVENSTLHDFKGSNYQELAGKIDESKVKTYKVNKSVDDSRLDRIEKAIEALASQSSGKKSVISEKVEKSTQADTMDSTRFLARTFLGRF